MFFSFVKTYTFNLFRHHNICIKRGEIPTRVLLKYILLLSTQMRIIAVHQSLVPASPCPQWMFPTRVVFIVVVLVIKIYALFSDVHPFYHLTRGSKSQKIKWARIWQGNGCVVLPIVPNKDRLSESTLQIQAYLLKTLVSKHCSHHKIQKQNFKSLV